MLAKRSIELMYDEEYVRTYSSAEAIKNPYNSETNQEGIVNIGTAISELMDDVLLEKLNNSSNMFEIKTELFRYYQYWGPDSFRIKLAAFLTEFFKPSKKIDFENIMVLNGALLSLDILESMLLDNGEYILCPSPAYAGYFPAGTQRWKTQYLFIPMPQNKENRNNFELTLGDIEKMYEESLAEGKVIRAFLLNNPHNPLGKIFSKSLVVDILKFCQKNKLHVIVDEMYCLSIFNPCETFHSVFELDDSSLIDEDLVHIIWGFSKDLCLTSFRTGLIHTKNTKLKMALKSMSQFQAVPLLVMRILENFITDIDWIKNVFVPENHKRLLNAYEYSKSLIESLGVETTKTEAGFFFMADFSPFLNPCNKKSTEELFKKFYMHKVYVVPYWEMKMTQVGWIRIVFSVTKSSFQEGFRRLKKALDEWKEENNIKQIVV